MNPREHALFRAFPLDGTATVSTGAVPTPYHVYQGYGLFIGGSADMDAVRALLAPEQVRAVQTVAGRALMGVWVCNFTDASLGAHHELQFSIFASADEQPGVDAHPLGLLPAMLERPQMRMLCHGLWNDRPEVVAYNRELLALNARLAISRIEREPGAIGFAFRDAATGARILEGRIHRPQRASLRASCALLGRLGPKRVLALARQPWLRVQILNPVGPGLARNAVADSYTKCDTTVLRYFDAARDTLDFDEPRYRRLQFRPEFFQFMDGFKFVYLFPR
jgi:hypothetical protein